MHNILAYLDPGSGSALIGTIIAVAGAGLYSLKSFFYRLLRKPTAEEREAEMNLNPDIAIFSEGANYWGSFEGIVHELIARKIHFSYYTMDLHDPGLLVDDEHMHSHLCDKNKPASFHRLSKIRAKVLLSTTPNIGTPGYPLARPPEVKKLVHFFHAFADISAYHIGSLDNYDIVLTVGPQQEKPIREVEKARGLKAKRIVPVGLPYFDAQYKIIKDRFHYSAAPSSISDITILIASSWGAKGLLSEYGTRFIIRLAEVGFKVIVRPHPQSFIVEADFLERCKSDMSDFRNISWDEDLVGIKSMMASDILISDTSSIRFDYAFLFGKPVITLDIPREKQLEYEGQYMSEIWTDAAAVRIGRVIDKSQICCIDTTVREVLATFTLKNLHSFMEETIVNCGKSSTAVVDFLDAEVR